MIEPDEPRKLGLVGKALVALMLVVTVGLGIGAVIAVRRREAATRETRERLDGLAAVLRYRFSARPAKADGPGQDLTGIAAARARVQESCPVVRIGLSDSSETEYLFCAFDPHDAWGNPIYCRCPGPVHKNGWDLIASGPNGIFEEGVGDDIVVGEDLRGGIAAIESSR